MSTATDATRRPAPDGPAGPAAADRRTRLRACTVLLVDDEAANLDLLEALLESEGYDRLVRTTDSRQVAALASAHAPDLVLLDLHMPHRHGLEVLADLSASTPRDEYRPVLVLTADVTSEARDHALALGARDFVTKPFDTTEVLLRVENLLDTRVLHLDERRARERATLLAEWSRLLAASLDPGTALAMLPGLVVPRWATGCEAALGDDAYAQAGATDATPRVEAPVATGEGTVGAVALMGPGSDGRLPDQALADELATRLGMAAEHARLLAAAELATTERERLLAVVAHDLRNPLGAVALYAEVLRSLQPDDPHAAPAPADAATRAYARQALDTIHTSTAAMQRLVEDLLDASSLRGGALRVHRAPVLARAPFRDAERMLRPLAEAAGLVLDLEGSGPETTVAIDAPRVVQLLSNLVGNAVKFTPAGGTVTVRWSVEPATGEHVGALVGSVADTGPGIAADELPHLFTAFWRGDRRARRGVGLGLWIAQAIAAAHGGELRVESRPGAGTTFHFTLPFADAARRRED
jgi:signal transduction histidine kinase